MKFNTSFLLILISITIAIMFIYIGSNRQLTTLENVLFQLIILSIGLIGSFLFGRVKSKEIDKPRLRSAFRRLISLYRSLSRMAFIVSENQERGGQEDKTTLLKIESIITEQIFAVDDAMLDWYDITPEEVKDLYKSKNLFFDDTLRQTKRESDSE